MANRCYLYACDSLPLLIKEDEKEKEETSNKPERFQTGVSEWSYSIPLIYKILLSPNPQASYSSIWKHEEEIAIIGDFESGVSQLKEFLGRITVPSAKPAIEEALQFLDQEENQSDYLLLEPGEIYDLVDQELVKQHRRLLKQISNLHNATERALIEVNNGSESAYAELGFGNWQKYLYFDFCKD